MKQYVKELEKPEVYNPENLAMLCQFEDGVNPIVMSTLLVSLAEKQNGEEMNSTVGEDKASFVTYNGVPYNKQS